MSNMNTPHVGSRIRFNTRHRGRMMEARIKRVVRIITEDETCLRVETQYHVMGEDKKNYLICDPERIREVL